MSIVKEFKAFVLKGNVMDLAIGLIIGAAFGKIVTSMVEDIIMPPVGLLLGGVNFTELKYVLKGAATDASGKVLPAVSINYGNFIQVCIVFLIIAMVVFMIIKGMNSMKKREAVAPTVAVPPSAEENLLTEIRDLLAKRNM